MAEILPTASYVRNPKAFGARAGVSSIISSIDEGAKLPGRATEEVWELLETPQTIDSLCRSLEQQNVSSDRMRSLLAELYDRDLIQVSPDT